MGQLCHICYGIPNLRKRFKFPDTFLFGTPRWKTAKNVANQVMWDGTFLIQSVCNFPEIYHPCDISGTLFEGQPGMDFIYETTNSLLWEISAANYVKNV